MYPSAKTRELAVLLRISRELDVCGDLTATVDNPSELIAWASVLADPAVLAWRAQDSGCRFVHVAAHHHRAPIRGYVTAVMSCEQHPEFWDALHLANLEAGRSRSLSIRDLAEAWKVMPIIPPDTQTTPEPPSRTQDASPARPAPVRQPTTAGEPNQTSPTTPDPDNDAGRDADSDVGSNPDPTSNPDARRDPHAVPHHRSVP
jgi:hypothetical protein